MAGPGPGPKPKQSANLKSKRLIYLTNAQIFRFIENNPYTCVQVVTYKVREPDEMPIEPSNAESKVKGPKMEEIIRYVQYWNCAGFEDGEVKAGVEPYKGRTASYRA